MNCNWFGVVRAVILYSIFYILYFVFMAFSVSLSEVGVRILPKEGGMGSEGY